MNEQDIYERLDEAIAMVKTLAGHLDCASGYGDCVSKQGYEAIKVARSLVEQHQRRVYPTRGGTNDSSIII